LARSRSLRHSWRSATVGSSFAARAAGTRAREERGRAEQEYVEVEARTLYEAVGLAIDRFRRREHVKIRVHGHLERVGPDDGGVGVLSGVSTACSLSLLW